MLTRKLAITCLAAFLTSCAAHTSKVVPEQFLQPTVIEGTHSSLDAVMADPTTTTYDLYRFGGNAEDGLQRCNADKASAPKSSRNRTDEREPASRAFHWRPR